MPFIAEAIALISTIAASVSSFVAVSGFIGQALISVGLGIASSYLLQQLMPKGGAGIQSGTQLDHKYGSSQPRQVAIGKCGIAGHDVLIQTFNENNIEMHQVFALSDYYTTGLLRVAIGGQWVTLGAPDAMFYDNWIPVTTSPYNGLIYLKFYDGRQTVVSPFLNLIGNATGKWLSTYVGKGISYVAVYVKYDREDNNSFPDFFFEFEGAPLYDWRKDSSVGGSGAHRWNDKTTHEYSENPIVAAYNYRRGFSIDDDIFCGMDMPTSDLPLDKWTAAANVCDETDGVDPRYRVSSMLSAMATHGDNLKTLSIACGAMEIDDLDGAYPIVGTDQASVITFYDTDIISVADNFRYTARVSMSELVNSVAGNYPEPDEVWSPVGYEQQIDVTALTLDRRSRDVSIDFPQVPYKKQCEQLASIYLQENRFEAQATMTLRPRFQTLQVGDWIDWVSARYGFTKTFIVVNKGLLSLDSEGPRNAVITIKERSGTIYDGVSTDPYVPSVYNPDPVYSTEVDSFAAIAASVTGADGRVSPAIRVSWATLTDETVSAVEVIYYPTAQPSAVISKMVERDRSVVYLSDVVAGTEYTVKARIITNPPRATALNAGNIVTTSTLNLVLPDFDASIREQMVDIPGYLQDQLNEITNTIAGIVASQDARNWKDKKEVRSQLNSTYLANKAFIETVQTVSTAADAALASDITTLSATVDDNTADIVINATAIATLNSSFSSYQTTVTAQFGTVNSSVSTVENAIATLNGYAAAQWAITLDVNGYAIGFELLNGGSGSSQAAFVVDKFKIAAPGVTGGSPVDIFTVGNVSGSPKIGIKANMFIDGTITATMLNVTSMSAITANIGTATAGVVRSSDSKFLIDLNNKRLVIQD